MKKIWMKIFATLKDDVVGYDLASQNEEQRLRYEKQKANEQQRLIDEAVQNENIRAGRISR